MTLRPGTMLSHYRLVEKIGEGGMGVVYRAEDTKLRRQVALKVLPPELVANEERRLRFLREARTAAAVNHPNIATVHEIDEADGVVFITMELVQGKTLRRLIGGRPMPIPDVLRIATAMAEGLAEAHKAHVIHRDLKPENVIVSKAGHTKILDFGLAKLHEDRDELRRSELSHLETVSGEMTREGKVMGTPAYMSPEQARGSPVDTRSDLFSFGTTLYEMATGRVPFRGKTITDTLSAIIRDEATPASQVNSEVPPELDRILAKCLEKEPDERYQHTDDLVVDLRHLKRETDSGVQRIPTPTEPVTRPTKAHRRWNRLALYGALAITIVAVAAYFIWKPQPAPQFEEGDVVIVADFQNTSDRPMLGVQVRDAFENMMAGSQFIHISRRKRGAGGAGTMDRRAARLHCRGGNCEGFVTGSVVQDHSAFVLQVALYHLDSATPVVTRTTRAAEEEGVLDVIHELVIDLRRSLGEAPEVLSMTDPPTTRSLSAYQFFANSSGLPGADKRLALEKRALEIDPGFVRARIRLAGSLWSLGKFTEWQREWKEIHGRRDGLPDRIRMSIEIYYLWSSYQFDAELERIKAYLELYPYDGGMFTSLCFLNDLAYEDLSRAIEYARTAYQLRPDALYLSNLCELLSFQGDASEIERLAREFRADSRTDFTVPQMLLYAAAIRGEEPEIRRRFEEMSRISSRAREFATSFLLEWLLASGRLGEARETVSAASRLARESNYLQGLAWAELRRSWLESRFDGHLTELPEDAFMLARDNLTHLPVFAAFSVEINLSEPLAQLIHTQASATSGSDSRYVREELQFARGCLALIEDDLPEARNLLEPLARDSELTRRHRMLGRTYEKIGLLERAAEEFEKALENPHLKWNEYDHYIVAAEQVLEQFRLARIYDRLGNTDRARHWYERFTEDWEDADPDIPELIEVRKRLAELKNDSKSDAAPASSESASR